MKKILNRIRLALSEYKWDLAYGNYTDCIITNGLKAIDYHIIKNPFVHKWFADPFILDESSEELKVLVEEFDDRVNRGRIARLVIDKRTHTITDCKIVLDLSTHLSFPAIYKMDDKIYVHPENSASGTSKIYLYDEEQEMLTNPITILDKPLTDAVIVAENGLHCMYATQIPTSSRNRLDVYQSDTFEGPYIYIKTIDFCKNNARMAGLFISIDGSFIRPAQDNNHDYGEAVLFYNGTKIIGEIRPQGLPYEGVHTFNKSKNTFVIDLKKYNYPILHSLLKNVYYKLF
jgi:hypothetical protein